MKHFSQKPNLQTKQFSMRPIWTCSWNPRGEIFRPHVKFPYYVDSKWLHFAHENLQNNCKCDYTIRII